MGKLSHLVAFVAIAACPAVAEERFSTLAVGGDWHAVAYHESLISAPTMCGAMNLRTGVLFRVDADDAQIRVVDNNWSLPADVVGSISIKIGDYSDTWDITENTAVMVAAATTRDDLVRLLDAMDRAASMAVTVGKAKPIATSLVGSTRATNAFRTCARLRGAATAPGSNPFR